MEKDNIYDKLVCAIENCSRALERKQLADQKAKRHWPKSEKGRRSLALLAFPILFLITFTTLTALMSTHNDWVNLGAHSVTGLALAWLIFVTLCSIPFFVLLFLGICYTAVNVIGDWIDRGE